MPQLFRVGHSLNKSANMIGIKGHEKTGLASIDKKQNTTVFIYKEGNSVKA